MLRRRVRACSSAAFHAVLDHAGQLRKLMTSLAETIGFSAKGGPGALRGQATTELPEAFSKGGVPGIMWEDGNVWERVG